MADELAAVKLGLEEAVAAKAELEAHLAKLQVTTLTLLLTCIEHVVISDQHEPRLRTHCILNPNFTSEIWYLKAFVCSFLRVAYAICVCRCVAI